MEEQAPPQAQGLNIKHIADLFYRKKMLIIVCVLLATSAGLGVYLLQPKIYQSTALLSYQQQSINPAQMSPDEQERIKDIVSTLSQIVTSRTNLEKIITDEGLFKDEISTLPMQDVVAKMREHIIIQPSKDGDIFHITYEATNPKKVGRVTNTLASGFITENMKYREEKASETSAYTLDELNMAKVILDKKEAVMRDYKLKFYNEMPEQRRMNMSRLVALQTQEQGKQESIQELKRTRVLIREQISVRNQILTNQVNVSAQLQHDNTTMPPETSHNKLKRLQSQLDGLKDRYTDQHPQVKSLKRKIAHLKQTLTEEVEETTQPKTTKPAKQIDSTLVELQMEIKSIDLSVQKIDHEISYIQKLIKQYEQWINATPVREAEWSALTREYGELKRHYDFLVSQNLQASSALNLERKQKGSQFKIIDAARTPTRPVKPDFLKVMGLALLAGCGLGAALSIGLNLIDTSFKNQAKLAEAFNLEIICSVPHLPLKKEIIKKRVMTIVSTIFVLCWTAAIMFSIFYFWQQGRIIIFSTS